MKLLNLTIRTYVIYSAILAIVSIPIFYFIVNGLVMGKLDNELRLQKEKIEGLKKEFHSPEEVEFYQRLDPDIDLVILNSYLTIDTLFNSFRFNYEHGKETSHREYHTTVTIDNQLYELIVRKPMMGTKDLTIAVVITQSIFMLSLLIGLTFINRKLSQRIWQPFYKTLDRLKKIRIEEETDELTESSAKISEFKDLQSGLNELIARNRTVYNQQKKFTANAAHELQTPLAIFQSNLDLLMQSRSLDEEQALITQTLLDATRRLSKLQKALLLLARIEGNQFIENNEINLKDLSNGIFARFQHKIEDKSFVVKKIFEAERTLTANTELVETLLTNLLTNAIRYTPSKGEIKWIVKDESFEIHNTGDQLSLEKSQLFDRFKKDERTGNIGLGLAIAKQISENYGWFIDYQYKDGFHQFSIRFI